MKDGTVWVWWQVAYVTAAVVLGYLIGRYRKSGSPPDQAEIEAAIKLGRDVAEAVERVAEGLDLVKAQAVEQAKERAIYEQRKAEVYAVWKGEAKHE